MKIKTKNKKERAIMRFLKPMAVVLLLSLVIGIIPAVAVAEREVKLLTLPASDSSKREVVYARLKATGDVDNIYVVNHFQPSHKISITDHGEYSEVIQLTGEAPPVLSGTTVSIAEVEGPYYYQGNLKSLDLPWKTEIEWKLDGEKREPATLSGAEGELEFTMNIKSNDAVNADFFKQYALQISIPIDPERAKLEAASEGFMVSYAGSEHQLTYIALPGKETTIKAVFRVKDFAMGQITLAGIPLAFDIDPDDFGELDKMLEPLDELSSGIAEFADGAAKLRKGHQELLDAFGKVRDGSSQLVSGGQRLASGADKLKTGIKDYTSGVDRYTQGVGQLSNGYRAFDEGLQAMYRGTKQLNAEGARLKEASVAILQGLNQIVAQLPPPESLEGMELPAFTPEMLAQLDALAAGSAEFRGALAQLAAADGGPAKLYAGLTQMREQLTLLKQQADQFTIPDDDINPMTAVQWYGYLASLGFTFAGTPGNDALLYNQLAGMSQLAAGYKPAVQMLRGTIDGLLDQTQGVPALENGAGQLLGALQQLSANYGGIHDGLTALVNQVKGFAGLAGSVAPLLSGYADLVNGLHQLQAGYAGVYDANGKPVAGPDGQPMIGFHNGLAAYLDQGVGGLIAGYEGVNGKPGILSGSAGIKKGLAELAKNGNQLSAGGRELRNGVSQTGQGISDYVGGVSSFRKGLDRYRADGLVPYSDGLKEFSDGAERFKEETGDLSGKFEEALREMLKEYQGSFEVKSFVSEENKDVASVQFVLMTEEIPPKAE